MGYIQIIGKFTVIITGEKIHEHTFCKSKMALSVNASSHNRSGLVHSSWPAVVFICQAHAIKGRTQSYLNFSCLTISIKSPQVGDSFKW